MNEMNSSIYSEKTMTADQCVAITLRAATRRKCEVLMGPGWLAAWLKMIAPGLVDKITVEMVLKPAVAVSLRLSASGKGMRAR